MLVYVRGLATDTPTSHLIGAPTRRKRPGGEVVEEWPTLTLCGEVMRFSDAAVMLYSHAASFAQECASCHAHGKEEGTRDRAHTA